MLSDLNRQAVEQIVPASSGDYGFRWNDGDVDSDEWWPQGITTSGDADASGEVEGRRLVVASWYAKPVGGAPSRGSRLSFVDVTDPLRPRYRHVLLVQPVHDKAADTWSLRPVRVHAGGIVWHGDTVMVADTGRGLRCFDVSDITRVDGPGFDKYRYVLPQRGSYRAVNDEGAEPFRFSFTSVDRGSDPHRLVVGEYGTGEQTTRLAAWELSPEGTGLTLRDGVAEPVAWRADGPGHMQGAVLVGDSWQVSVSRGRHRRGSLRTSAGGAWADHKAELAVGPEDLSYWPQTDRLWNLSEYPGHRFVYSIPRP